MLPAFIYFDLGNVIFFFDRERAFRQMAEASGVDASRVRDVVMDGGLQQSLERGLIGWEEFHAEFSSRTGTYSDPGVLARAASDMFDLNVGMLPVVAACERAGIPLGILSNTCAPHWDFLASGRYGIVPGTFREIVLSHEAGMAKPDRGIYALAAARAGVEPARIFFCDDLPEHVAAARAAGWDAELFTTAPMLADQLGRRGLLLGL
ncbi:MAG: HAD family phosphatase [Pirellulales bacterium]